MQVLEVRDWNFLRAFQCICAEPSSGPGALQGPSVAIVILDNILHLQDITAPCCVPLNTAFVCLNRVCQVQLCSVDISGWVYGPAREHTAVSDTQENMFFTPENSQVTWAWCFLAAVGMPCSCSETRQSQPSSSWKL